MGRPRKMIETIPAELPAEVQKEASGLDVIVLDTSVPLTVEEITQAPTTAQDRITALIEHLRGTGLELSFDDYGVTFRRGYFVEFVNYSASDRNIVTIANRIAGR